MSHICIWFFLCSYRKCMTLTFCLSPVCCSATSGIVSFSCTPHWLRLVLFIYRLRSILLWHSPHSALNVNAIEKVILSHPAAGKIIYMNNVWIGKPWLYSICQCYPCVNPHLSKLGSYIWFSQVYRNTDFAVTIWLFYTILKWHIMDEEKYFCIYDFSNFLAT